jgi:hypothetical protein
MEVSMNREVLKFPTGASKGGGASLEASFFTPGKIFDNLKPGEL